jgi:hypothetical protein
MDPLNPPTAGDLQAQSDANFARQLELQMVSESIAAKTNVQKLVHETQMAVIQNFK